MYRKPLAAIWVLVLSGAQARGGTPLVVSSDVPTAESASLNTLLPFQVYRYDVPATYSLVLSVPGQPTLDGLHKLDRPWSWLLSLGSASDLGGALGGAVVAPRDIIRFDEDTGSASSFFCGAAVGVPVGVNVDAFYMRGGDFGDLLVSFDVPVKLSSFTFEPADLARFLHTGTTCGGWTLASINPDFDASMAGDGIPTSANLIGAEQLGSLRLLTFDVPLKLGPPGVTTYVPGQVVSWDGASFSLFENLVGWPISSAVDGLASGGNPGVVPPTLLLAKTASPQLDTTPVELSWSASCSAGASYYAFYEGTLGAWYSHTATDCADELVPLTEVITPSAGNRYFLVVPHNGLVEGSYGSTLNFPPGFDSERPVGTVVCASQQVVTPCP